MWSGVGVARVTRPTGEGDLARVPAEVRRAEGEQQARHLAPDDEGNQHRRVAQLEPGEIQRATRMLLQPRRELGEARVHQRRAGSPRGWRRGGRLEARVGLEPSGVEQPEEQQPQGASR